MARIEVTTHIEAPPERVWGELVQWESQSRWMADLDSLTVLSAQREGTGVEIRARTRLLPGVVVDDDMVTTEWREPEVIAVRHAGPLIRGVAAFELAETQHGTRFTWWEEIEPPLGPVGELFAELLAVPHLRRVFRRSLAALKRVSESTSVRP